MSVCDLPVYHRCCGILEGSDVPEQIFDDLVDASLDIFPDTTEQRDHMLWLRRSAYPSTRLFLNAFMFVALIQHLQWGHHTCRR